MNNLIVQHLEWLENNIPRLEMLDKSIIQHSFVFQISIAYKVLFYIAKLEIKHKTEWITLVLILYSSFFGDNVDKKAR